MKMYRLLLLLLLCLPLFSCGDDDDDVDEPQDEREVVFFKSVGIDLGLEKFKIDEEGYSIYWYTISASESNISYEEFKTGKYEFDAFIADETVESLSEKEEATVEMVYPEDPNYDYPNHLILITRRIKENFPRENTYDNKRIHVYIWKIP